MTTTDQAKIVFQAAYENRYTWDDNFPGYVANVELKQGEEVYQGRVRVNSDLSVEISDIQYLTQFD